jgi:RNA polymerase sigma-70 factor (ECF subfamily)
LRERKSETDVFALVVPVKPTQLAEAALKQITNRVSALLNDMPPKLRVTFRLAFMEGLTHAEISQRLGDPLGTTKSRIRQALCLIRKKLNSNTKITKGDGHV